MSHFLALRDRPPEVIPGAMNGSQYRPLNRDEFEIAIICALPREANAVLNAMDEKWDEHRQYYGKGIGDDNSYDFGKIGLHSVVIVTLPSMGMVKASSSSRSLKMSFPSIKLALLVGICGGVPFKKDGSEIVLGDVIIGETIVELDLGGQYTDTFRRKNALIDVHGRPNEEIMGLLQRWKIPAVLDTLQQGFMVHLGNLQHRLNIQYPGVEQDHLFEAGYIHKHRESCMECSESPETACSSAIITPCRDVPCDENNLVARQRLETAKSQGRTPDLAIHIGSIGTSNSVMKSAWHRDQQAELEGIIAFEMEGVGVWDKFNCLVIKGVCDYADSHKNKTWQDFAAASAAAVAKEILRQYVIPQRPPPSMIPTIQGHDMLDWELLSRYQHSNLQIFGGAQDARPGYLADNLARSIEGPIQTFASLEEIQQQIISSLQFPQMQERAQQIETAHEETYEWILRSQEKSAQKWDDFAIWLASSTERPRIYWISGKPGSGKSTLMRFLKERLHVQEHMLPWASESRVIQASFFSWGPGNKFQKSLEGLFRSLLMQILKQNPDIMPDVIDETRWATIRMAKPSAKVDDWTILELLSSLERCIQELRKLSTRVLLFIDGLDEFECTDDMLQELMDQLNGFSRSENVKMILSGRPWNIFLDSLSDVPSIRLEDLTRDDIRLYVHSNFLKNQRFHYLRRYDKDTADGLISAVTQKAQGVFLWVRIVVRNLLRGFRDGDSIRTLYQKLEDIPADLNNYFERLFLSIEPQHRKEASIILQVALHIETEFAAMHPLRLLDLSFSDELSPDFALADPFNYRKVPMDDGMGLMFRLDSTMRRINSRCMGLLECTYSPGSFSVLFDEDEYPDDKYKDIIHQKGCRFDPSIYSKIFSDPKQLRSLMLDVDFLHRSCQEFLLSPHILSQLYEYTDGPFNSRMFLVNAMISQFLAMMKFESGRRVCPGMASYIMSAITVPELKDTASSIRAAQILKPAIEELAIYVEEMGSSSTGWYIDYSLENWESEQSNFLTVAIDFDLRGYYTTYLTKEEIQTKKGRPILDYILRPRFGLYGAYLKNGNTIPSVDLLQQALYLGADPNALYGGISVWALFLSWLSDWLSKGVRVSEVNM